MSLSNPQMANLNLQAQLRSGQRTEKSAFAAGSSPQNKASAAAADRDQKRAEEAGGGPPIEPATKRSRIMRDFLYSIKETSDPITGSGLDAGSQDDMISGTAPSHVIKVIIADDHSMFREGVKMTLSRKKDIQMIGEAENGVQLLHLLRHHRPDVILLDIQMPVMDGIAALGSIHRLYPDIRVVMLSMHDGNSMVSRLMEKGANAFLTKTADSESIYEAIKTVYAKNYYFNELTNMAMLESLRSKNKASEKVTIPRYEESSDLMVRLKEAQVKSARRQSLQKFRKQALVALISLVLIAGGILAGLSIKGSTKSKIISGPAAPAASSRPAFSAPKQIPQAAVPAGFSPQSPAPQQAEITREPAAAGQLPVLKKERAVTNRSKDSVHRLSEQLSGQLSPQIIPEPAEEPKHEVAAAPDNRAMVKNSIRNLVTVSGDGFHKGILGGISNIELTVKNHTKYTIDKVVVEVQYILKDDKVYKTELLNFQDISPESSEQLEAPKSSRGVRIEYKIISISSRELDI